MGCRWRASAAGPVSTQRPTSYRRGTAKLAPLEMRRLAQLEDVNAKLQKLVADLSLDREMRQDVIRRRM